MAILSFYVFFLVFSFLSLTSGSPINIIVPKEDNLYKLPENLLTVEHYDIELTLKDDVFETNVFDGTVSVKFTMLQDANSITIHADGIDFSKVILKDSDNINVELATTNFTSDPKTTSLTIETTEILRNAVTYIFYFEYTALLRTDTSYHGLYKSSYQTSTGETKYLATTQFQTTAARRAFPCFDEPSYKAKFDIKINHPSKYNAKSNTPGTTKIYADYTQTTFKTTPVMSTYLIAFVISEFTCTEGAEIEPGYFSEVCSQPETENVRDFGVEIGPKIISAIEDLTGVKYSESGIGKLHQFGIPDFSAGAMENWGLVTYREYYLLWDPEHSTNKYKQNVATIISHEFGHFWFGDLVTTHWWSDTFLNEGFATYYEYFGAAQVLPDWELEKQFVIDQVHYGLSADQTVDSDPLSYPAYTPEELSKRFGTVSYSKGGSIFRMVEHFIGSEDYKQGIKNYLETNEFKNTKPEHLWASLAAFNTKDLPRALGTIMNNWVNTPGFPLLTVKRNDANVVISQQRFLLSGTDTTSKWFVPIAYTQSNDEVKFESTETRAWLLPTEDLEIQNALIGEDAWIILNNYQAGFYRVDYDKELWQNIIKALKQKDFGGIPDLNRGHLVDDLYNMARAGIHSFIDFFEFISFLENDDSYFAWYEAFTAINYLLPKIGNEKVQTFILKYVGKLIEVFYNSVPVNESKDDDQIYSLKRVLAGSWGCKLGFENCKEYALGAFADYRDTLKKPDKNLRSTIYCNGLRYSGNLTDDWDFLFSKFLEERKLIKTNILSSTEQSNMLSALGCLDDQNQIKIFLQKSIDSESGLTPALLSSVFAAVYSNSRGGVDTSFDFVIENYKAIADFYGNYEIINSLISSLGSRFTKIDQIEKLDNFIKTSNLPDNNKESAKKALANAEEAVTWTEAFEKEVISFYDLNNSGSSSLPVQVQISVIILSCLFLLLQNL